MKLNLIKKLILQIEINIDIKIITKNKVILRKYYKKVK